MDSLNFILLLFLFLCIYTICVREFVYLSSTIKLPLEWIPFFLIIKMVVGGIIFVSLFIFQVGFSVFNEGFFVTILLIISGMSFLGELLIAHTFFPSSAFDEPFLAIVAVRVVSLAIAAILFGKYVSNQKGKPLGLLGGLVLAIIAWLFYEAVFIYWGKYDVAPLMWVWVLFGLYTVFVYAWCLREVAGISSKVRLSAKLALIYVILKEAAIIFLMRFKSNDTNFLDNASAIDNILKEDSNPMPLWLDVLHGTFVSGIYYLPVTLAVGTIFFGRLAFNSENKRIGFYSGFKMSVIAMLLYTLIVQIVFGYLLYYLTQIVNPDAENKPHKTCSGMDYHGYCNPGGILGETR